MELRVSRNCEGPQSPDRRSKWSTDIHTLCMQREATYIASRNESHTANLLLRRTFDSAPEVRIHGVVNTHQA